MGAPHAIDAERPAADAAGGLNPAEPPGTAATGANGLPAASGGQSRSVTFRVIGMEPAPQGSKTPMGRKKPTPPKTPNGRPKKGRIILVESCKRVKPWRILVADAAVRSGATLIRGPVTMSCVFIFTRPKGHFGKRGLLPSAPRWHMVKPDGSKLLRSTEDALSSVLYEDDARIVSGSFDKRYAVGDELPGAIITLTPLPL